MAVTTTTETTYIEFLDDLAMELQPLTEASAEARKAFTEATESLKKLRAFRQLKQDLTGRDPLGRDGTIATERYHYELQIASISTDVDQVLVPALKRLIEALGTEGRAQGLVNTVERAPRPGTAELTPPALSPGALEISHLSRGFTVMRQLDTSNLRGLAQTYGPDFETARIKLARFAMYKVLHAQLHMLRLQHYENVVGIVGIFALNQLSLSLLQSYEEQIRDLVDRSRQAVDGKDLLPTETDWIDDLATACSDLRAGVVNSNVQSLELAIRRMRRVLATKPEVINVAILTIARELEAPLERLHTALQAAATLLLLTNQASGEAREMQTASQALRDLHQRLEQLVLDHDAWQEIDRECRRVEREFTAGLDDFEFSWPDLRQKVAQRCEGDSDWARELRKLIDLVVEAQTAADANGLTGSFRVLCRAVARHFFAVDEELHSMCKELDNLDGPLAKLISLMAWSTSGDAPA